jgi:uncharacterized membrane protein
MNTVMLMRMGVGIIFVGFILLVLGTFLGSGGSASSGGFILIGPIPIVFGSGPNSGTLATVALAITVVMVVAYAASFLFWRSRRRVQESKSE